MVHPGLAADGCIDHGQQCCGYLHDPDPAQPCGRSKARHVTHNPTSEGQHQRAAFKSLIEGGVMDRCHRGWRLVLFAGLNHQQFGFETVPAQAVQAGRSIRTSHIGIAHHQNSPTFADAGLLELCSDSSQTASADHHLIGISFQGNRNSTQGGGGNHGKSIHCRHFARQRPFPARNLPSVPSLSCGTASSPGPLFCPLCC